MAMVICIAGLIGTGKTSLAESLAKKLDVLHYDVDAVKKEIYPTDPDYEYNLANNIPFSTETRRRVFEKVVADFADLSKKHSLIIVDETFHKASLRTIVFDGADTYFGGHLLIWIKADENVIKHRLEGGQREGHILKNAFGMYLSFKDQFEEFEHPDIVFYNNKPLEESSEELVKLVKEKLK